MKQSLLFILLVGFATMNCYCQLVSLEYRQGLYQALTSAQTDSAKLPILHKIGKYYLSKNDSNEQGVFVDSALTIFKKAVNLSKAIHLDDGYGQYESLRLLGTAYLIKKDTANARHFIMQYIHYYGLKNQPKKVMIAWTKYGESSTRANFSALALQCYQQALVFAEKTRTIEEEFLLRCHIANNLYALGNQETAINDFLAIIKEFKGKKYNLDRAYLSLAYHYRYKGDINKSLQYGLAGISEMELYRDTLHAHAYYAEIALTYELLGETQKSIGYYKKTLELRSKMSIPEEYILRTAGFIVQGLIKLGKYKEALEEVKAIEASHPPKTLGGKATIAQSKAYCYEALKDYSNAEKYYLQMIRDYERSGKNDEIVVLARHAISNFYVTLNRYDKAKYYIRDVGNTLPSFDLYKKVELLRFRIDSGAGNYRQAMRHYINYQKMKDSIFNESKSKQIEELQIKYEIGQKEKDIALLKKDSQLQRDRVKQANYIRNLTFAGVGSLLIILVLLYKSFRSNRKKSKEIDLKNLSLSQLLTEKDDLLDEKEWLMKEVHHRVKNNLQIVMGLLQRQSSFTNNKDALSAIHNSEHRLQAIAMIHQKLYQSDSMAMVKMMDYINEMIGYLQDSFSLDKQIRFEKEIENIDLDINVAVPIGLILNEAITNSIKYAFPVYKDASIKIILKQTAKACYQLRIADNGIGLTEERIENTNSMGFSLMKGLSKQVGGTFHIDNNEGTSITVNFCPEQRTRNG